MCFFDLRLVAGYRRPVASWDIGVLDAAAVKALEKLSGDEGEDETSGGNADSVFFPSCVVKDQGSAFGYFSTDVLGLSENCLASSQSPVGLNLADVNEVKGNGLTEEVLAGFVPSTAAVSVEVVSGQEEGGPTDTHEVEDDDSDYSADSGLDEAFTEDEEAEKEGEKTEVVKAVMGNKKGIITQKKETKRGFLEIRLLNPMHFWEKDNLVEPFSQTLGGRFSYLC
ncbi:hypothetical protein U1Q18_032717 [Sarracenia purpurea var. burkii]